MAPLIHSVNERDNIINNIRVYYVTDTTYKGDETTPVNREGLNLSSSISTVDTLLHDLHFLGSYENKRLRETRENFLIVLSISIPLYHAPIHPRATF